MNILVRILAVSLILFLFGCETTGGGGGSSSSATSDSGGGFTDEQLKKMGIKETYGKRN